MRSRMNAFMRSATGAFDWSRVVSQTGHTSSVFEIRGTWGVCRPSDRSDDEEPGEHDRENRADTPVHGSRALSIAASRRARSSSELTAPTNASTTCPSRSMTNVSGNPVTP
jgi:hypothetical protein